MKFGLRTARLATFTVNNHDRAAAFGGHLAEAVEFPQLRWTPAWFETSARDTEEFKYVLASSVPDFPGHDNVQRGPCARAIVVPEF